MNSNLPDTSPMARPDMKPRSSSEGAQTTNSDIAPSRTMSPTSTLTPSSSSTSTLPPTNKEHRRTMSFGLLRSRSKSPRPPPPVNLSISPPPPLKHTQTSPVPEQSPKHGNHHRHRSDGAAPPPPSRSATSPTSPTTEKHHWIQKKPRYSGSSPGGVGRHANDWLFGGFSITGTVKEAVLGGARRKEEDKDGHRRG